MVNEQATLTHPHRKAEESAVRGVIDELTAAVRLKNVDALVTHCSSEVRTFDLVPPLQHVGVDAVRDVWKRTLQGFESPIEYEVHRLDVAVGDDIAFSRSLNRFGGMNRDGAHVVNWLCVTLGFGKVDGAWKILHQHVSVPIDMETGKALLGLRP